MNRDTLTLLVLLTATITVAFYVPPRGLEKQDGGHHEGEANTLNMRIKTRGGVKFNRGGAKPWKEATQLKSENERGSFRRTRDIGQSAAVRQIKELQAKHMEKYINEATQTLNVKQALEDYKAAITSSRLVQVKPIKATGKWRSIRLTAWKGPHDPSILIPKEEGEEPLSKFDFIEMATENIGVDDPELIQGDYKVHDKVKPSGNRRKRNAIMDELWPSKSIPIWFNQSSFSNHVEPLAQLQVAISDWEEVTCLTFPLHLTADPPSEHHIIVQGSKSGCWADLGYDTRQIYQRININEVSCMFPGAVAHELAHSFGLDHEHRRPDMNSYMLFHPENTAQEIQFRSRSRDDSSVFAPYDASSLMHYRSMSFSKNGKETIVPRGADLTPLMGRRLKPEWFDAYNTNQMYQCREDCPDMNCANGGYEIKQNGVCQCLCPHGLGGSDCNEIDRSVYPCGDIIKVNQSPMIFTSPSYPQDYSSDSCMWLLKQQEGKPLRLTFNSNFYINCTSEHSLAIRANHITQQAPALHCGNTAPVDLTTRDYSESGMMMVILRSGPGATGSGFEATVNTDYDGCVGDPCHGALCVAGSQSLFTCQSKAAEIHCEFGQGLTGGCADLMLNDRYQDPTLYDYHWSLNEGMVKARADYTPKPKQQGTFRTKPMSINGQSCLYYEHDLSAGGSGKLNVYKAVNGVLGPALQTHITGSGIQVNQLLVIGNPSDMSEIVFEAIYENSYKTASIAITKLHWQNGECPEGECAGFPCGQATCQPSGTGTPLCVLNSDEFECSLDDSESEPTACHKSLDTQKIQPDVIEWILSSGSTPTAQTGPDAAYSGEKYIYLETSYRSTGDSGSFTLPGLIYGQDFCFSFHYYMYGWSMGTLEIYRKVNGVRESSPLWSISGDQGQEWKFQQITVPKDTYTNTDVLKIDVHGIRGSSYYSDMAIDDLKITPGPC